MFPDDPLQIEDCNFSYGKTKNQLKAAFKEAENEPDLKETMDDWAALDGEDWDA